MTLEDLFKDYASLPEFLGIELNDVEQVSAFGDRPIHVAATRGSIEELRLLAAAGASLDVAGEHGYTPLHCAAEQGCREAVSWLLSQGADPARVNTHNESPEELARVLGQHEIADLLKEHRGNR